MQLIEVSDEELTEDCVFIKSIVTHPGSSGVGGKLIQKGLNLITALNYPAELQLQTSYKSAKQAYLKLGFQRAPENDEEWEEELFSSIPMLFGEESTIDINDNMERFCLQPSIVIDGFKIRMATGS